jgi:uncharacterized membrane protein YfcA
MKILGFEYPHPLIHDDQHKWASFAGLIVGVTIFITYYFFSRTESQARREAGEINPPIRPWKMPWYYFVVGIILSAFAMSSIACVLSMSIRPRE